MKSLVKTVFVLATLFTTSTINAQINGGLGIDYGSEVEEAGLDVRVGYMLTEQWNLVADFNFFFVEDGGRYVERNYWNEVNFNAHYYFITAENLISPYALGGLGITFVGTKYDDHPALGDEKFDDTELGLNLGGGIDFNVDERLKPFFEVKYLLSDDLDQGEISFGLKYFLQ